MPASHPLSFSDRPRLGRIARNTILQIALLLTLILFIANVNALADSIFHPEIGYFHVSHLVVGSISAFGCGVLAVLLTAYLRHLRKALDIIKTLEGILPVCMYCRKIRKPDGDPHLRESWLSFETYFAERTHSRFSHGICPECWAKHHADLVPK